MKIEEAIKDLTELREIVFIAKSPDRNKALKLGIEALKARQKVKADGYIDLDDLLPGESDDAHSP